MATIAWPSAASSSSPSSPSPAAEGSTEGSAEEPLLLLPPFQPLDPNTNNANKNNAKETNNDNDGQDNDEANKENNAIVRFTINNLPQDLTPINKPLIPAGVCYFQFLKQKNNVRRGMDLNSFLKENEEDLKDTDSSLDFEEEEETDELLRSDPKEWKEQDHYAILGLSKLRWQATDEHIRRAYRRKVLKHHPDKKAGDAAASPQPKAPKGKKQGNPDDFFNCVQIAFEILSDPAKRKHFDSVDPTFDDSIPKEQKVSDVFAVYGPVFRRNARFSNIQPVPDFGDINTPYEKVKAFYDFWYNFDSWRVFNYLDEEDTSKAESREEKRYLEQINRKNRAELKAVEMRRVRQLTDQALANDPRIALHKQREKDKKNAEKLARQEALRQKQLEAERIAEEARQEQLKLKQEEEQRQQQLKKDKDRMKKQLTKERKQLRTVLKEMYYFLDPSVSLAMPEATDAIAMMEKLCETLSYEELSGLNQQLDANKGDKKKMKDVYFAKANQGRETAKDDKGTSDNAAESKQENSTSECVDVNKTETQKEEGDEVVPEPSSSSSEPAGPKIPSSAWSDKELVLLIQAIKLFPGGTIERWEKITAHINEHADSGTKIRTTKEVIKQSNELKKEVGKVPISHGVEIKRSRDDVLITEQPSVRTEFDGPAAKTDKAEAEKPWTKEEQAQLEAALKAIPASAENRWDKIAEMIPTRTKKECIQRFKKLAELVKQRKAAGNN